MSLINKHTDSYQLLSRIYIIDSNFKAKFIGFYDPECGKEWNFKYSNRLFPLKDGKGAYDDIYKGQNAIELSFIHYPFGTTNVGKTIKINAHMHTKFFVSTNSIKLDDVMVTDNDDIFFYADMHTKPKAINGGQFMLCELTPHLSSDELQRLKENAGEIVNYKEAIIKIETEKKQLEADLFFEYSKSSALNASLISYQQHSNALLKYQKELVNRVKSLSLAEAHLLNETIKDFEEKFDMNIDWNQVTSNVVMDTVSKGNNLDKFINMSNELANSNISEEMKNIMIEKVVNICGIQKVKEVIQQMEMSGNNRLAPTNMTAMNMRYLEDVQNGKLRPDEAQQYMNNAFNDLQNRTIKNGDINSALQEVNNDRGFSTDKLSIKDLMNIQKSLKSNA